MAAWFGDFTVSHTVNGDTLLTGEIADQAALYGVIGRCRSLGITLVSMYPTEDQGEKNEQDGSR